MRLLVTNDDGILAHGIECLIAAATPLGEVTVVAPDREQSATSHSLTLHHPVRPIKRAERSWQVDGTPTDCVMLAVEALMPERPDFVLSGINHGQNMGEDVLYSGTVAGAVDAIATAASGRKQPLVLVEADCARRQCELLGKIGDRKRRLRGGHCDDDWALRTIGR